MFFRFTNPYVMKVSLNLPLRVSHETAELWMIQSDKTCSSSQYWKESKRIFKALKKKLYDRQHSK